MKKRKASPLTTGQTNAIVEELYGYSDIGMKSAGLKLVRKILAKQLIEPVEFTATINTIGMYGSSADLRKWAEAVEAAYARQTPKTKKAINGDMLRYYQAVGNSESAVRFVTTQELKDTANALFIMELFLETNRMKEAKQFSRRCAKALVCEDDRFHASVLIEALAIYYARIREWDNALYFWERAPLEEPFRENATSGIVEIHLARALDATTQGLESLAELKKHSDPEDALSLPGNDDGMTLDAEKALQRYKRGIETLLHIKRRRELGLLNAADNKR